MRKLLQIVLLVLGVLALVALIGDIILSVQATTRSSTPVKVENVQAGPYALVVSFYRYPALAGYALPFAIAPVRPVQGTLTYQVNTVPFQGVDATPIRASLSPDASVRNGVQGTAEITVHGNWYLRCTVSGPSGPATVNVDVPVEAPLALPNWLGWFIGLLPLYGLAVFLLMPRKRGAQARLAQPLPPTTVSTR